MFNVVTLFLIIVFYCNFIAFKLLLFVFLYEIIGLFLIITREEKVTNDDKRFLVDKATIEAKFAELKTTGKQKLSGILNEWFDRIAEFQANKYSNSDIVKTLNEAGVDVTETQFRDIMFRLRKKRSGQKPEKRAAKPKAKKEDKPPPESADKLEEKLLNEDPIRVSVYDPRHPKYLQTKAERDKKTK